MPSPARHSRPSAFGRRTVPADARAGFSLIELSVTVMIISVLAFFAVPALKDATLKARAKAVANDLRVFAGAFQSYAQDKGDWPAGPGQAGEFPAGMEGLLAKTGWEQTTPVGGKYTWAPDSMQQGERFRALIVLASTETTRVTADRRQLIEIDRTIDDGDLETGNFRLGFRNFPIYVIEH